MAGGAAVADGVLAVAPSDENHSGALTIVCGSVPYKTYESCYTFGDGTMLYLGNGRRADWMPLPPLLHHEIEGLIV